MGRNWTALTTANSLQVSWPLAGKYDLLIMSAKCCVWPEEYCSYRQNFWATCLVDVWMRALSSIFLATASGGLWSLLQLSGKVMPFLQCRDNCEHLLFYGCITGLRVCQCSARVCQRPTFLHRRGTRLRTKWWALCQHYSRLGLEPELLFFFPLFWMLCLQHRPNTTRLPFV